jgi:hypothetical protein
METINVPTNPLIEAEYTVEYCLAQVPKKVHFREYYGIMLHIDGNCIDWSVRYHTYWPKAVHAYCPEVPTFRGSLKSILYALMMWFQDNYPGILTHMKENEKM